MKKPCSATKIDELLTAKDIASADRLGRLLAKFYQGHSRDFPWRSETAPYRLALAEVLLQKTRGDQAKKVYPILTERYPTPASLADADEWQLRTLLQPLGLNVKRANQLRRLGNVLHLRGSELFRDPEQAEKQLPGIGKYASRAIACFAFGDAVGIVDANVVRILERVFGISHRDPRNRIYQVFADRIVRRSPDPRSTNYALLDVGALICTRTPRCQECPLRSECSYAREPEIWNVKHKTYRRTAGDL